MSEPLTRRLRELVQHTAVYSLGPVLGQVAAFLLLPLYTNLLSPADYGTLEIIVLVSIFLNVFLGLQIVTQVLRSYHAAEHEDDRRQAVSTAIIFTGVLTAAAVVPADVFRRHVSVALFGTDAHAPLLRLGLWSMVASNVFTAALAYLQARKMSRAYTIIAVAPPNSLFLQYQMGLITKLCRQSIADIGEAGAHASADGKADAGVGDGHDQLTALGARHHRDKPTRW